LVVAHLVSSLRSCHIGLQGGPKSNPLSSIIIISY